MYNVFYAADTGFATLLLSLDLSAACDSINHNILISRLSSCFGLTVLALDWISSYLHSRRQSVNTDSMSPCLCLHIAPAYLTEMLVLKSTVPALSRLRSTATGDLLVPRTKTKTIGPRSFATSGPALWNKLPDDLRDPSLSLPVFKQRLKSLSVSNNVDVRYSLN